MLIIPVAITHFATVAIWRDHPCLAFITIVTQCAVRDVICHVEIAEKGTVFWSINPNKSTLFSREACFKA